MEFDLFRFLFAVFIGVLGLWLFLVATDRHHIVIGCFKSPCTAFLLMKYDLHLWVSRRRIRKIQDVFYLAKTEECLNLWASDIYVPFGGNRSFSDLGLDSLIHGKKRFLDLDKMLVENSPGQWDMEPANAALFPKGGFKLELQGAVAQPVDINKGVYRIGLCATLLANTEGKLKPFGVVIFLSSKFGSTRKASWFDGHPPMLFKRLSELRKDAEVRKLAIRHACQRYFPKRKESIMVSFGSHQTEPRIAEAEFYYDIVSPYTGIVERHLNAPYRLQKAKKDPDSILSISYSKCHIVSSVKHWLLPVSQEVKEAHVKGEISTESILKKEVARVVRKNKKAIDKFMNEASTSKEKTAHWNAVLKAYADLYRGTEERGPAAELPLTDSTVTEWMRRKILRMCGEENTRAVVENGLEEGVLLEIIGFAYKDDYVEACVRVNCTYCPIIRLY